ncbi:hypothetical protein CHS0354_019041 [Potamilus streckersoni]|uniref:Cadherin domain-containing protein n=1 Tax=Potamilus streckersoni TaxID=2493646 RepID=A0AAE0VWS3_9BIVA|nr:hypothetical protein CHS0354_019041 [Potamilus streckersoni]
MGMITAFLDINDNSPDFKLHVYNMNMNETQKTGSLVGRLGSVQIIGSSQVTFEWEHPSSSVEITLGTPHGMEEVQLLNYSPEFNTVTYWIAGGNGSNIFLIDSRTGMIYLEQSVDFDPPNNQKYFNLQIKASDLHENDNGHNITNVTTTVNIQVIDQNDNFPVFLKEPTHCVLPENKKDSFNCTVKATDNDAEDHEHVVYNITDHVIHQIFTINQSSGEILALKSLDFEKDSVEYTINVSAVDRAQHYGYHGLTIYLKDENDEKPMFLNTSYNFTVPENERLSTFVGRVIVRDMDKGSNLTFKLLDTTDFQIDGAGEIFTNKVFNCENPSEILKHFIVQVNDSVHIQNKTVTVHVLDQNDESPIFEYDVYAKTIRESFAVGTKVLTVNASDKDISKESNGLVRYKLLPADEHRIPFSIDNITGNVNVARPLINPYQALYIFYVIAEDQATDPSKRRTNSCEVRINITRDNLYAPVIHYPSNGVTVNISEAAIENSILLQATDEDQNTLSYALFDGSGNFTINNSTGVITVKNTLNREKIGLYNLTINVSDNGHAPVTCGFHVKIVDINDNSPFFTQTNYTFSIQEEKDLQTMFIKASDKDEGKNQEIIYEIIDGNLFGKFAINISTGELTAKRIDRETFGSKAHLIIRASDKGTPQMANITMVEVLIQDINDNPPVFQSQSIQLKVKENTLNGSFLYQLEAILNALKVKAIINALKVKAILNALRVRAILNALKMKAILNALKVKAIINALKVKAIINALKVKAILNALKMKAILNALKMKAILNALKVKAIINALRVKAIINALKVKAILNALKVKAILNALKMKAILNALKVKAIINALRVKAIINALKVKAILNALKVKAIINALKVKAILNALKMKAILNALKVKEIINALKVKAKLNALKVKAILNALKLKEIINALKVKTIINALKVKAIIKALKATDLDEEVNAVFEYRKINGSSFLAVNRTGAISIVHSLSIDEIKNGTLILYVEANNTVPYANQSIKNPMQVIQIGITDVNDKPPHFNQTYQFEINETQAAGSIIGRVQATDPDPTPEYNMVMYWIGSGNTNDAFHIDRYTGDIYLIKALDVDQKDSTTSYRLEEENISSLFQAANKLADAAEEKVTLTQVYASDIVPLVEIQGKNQSTTVNITVKDVNDNLPVFSSDIYRCAVKEGYKGTVNCTIHATDLDKMDNAHSLENFEFNKNGQLSLKKDVDFETLPNPKEFYLIVTAEDTGSHRSNATVVVRIIDVDDAAPDFLNTPYNFSIDENSKQGTKVGSVFAMDVDSKSISYTLNSSASTDFKIDKNGNLFVQREFDFEEQKENPIVISVTATDEMNNANDTVISVYILNINDNSPVFKNVPYEATINETLNSSSSVIITVSATDIDYGNISYSIIDGNTDNKFCINNSTGAIQCQGQHNAECQFNASIINRYDLIVQAMDGGKPPRMNVTSVTIFVIDVNNNPPRFSSNEYWAEVTENVESVKIITVAASDIDANNTLTFSVVGNNESGLFFFKGSDLMAHELDAENFTSIIMHINVTDGIYQDSAIVNVTVLDVNDNYPVLTACKNHSMPEDTKPNSLVIVVSATDKDVTNDGFTYVLLHSFGDFEIDPQNGTISLVNNLNFNERPSYRLTVRVYDHGTPPKTNESQIIINVLETNMHFPNFTNASYIFMSNENDTNAIFCVRAVDLDKGPAGNVSYSIVLGNEENLFYIDKYSGMIKFIKSPLYSDTPYFLEVKAIDNATHPRTNTANVTIHVKDVNQPPVWDSDHNYIYVNIGTKKEETILTIKAVDYDHDSTFKSITYFLQNQTNFTIDNITGIVMANIDLTQLRNYTLQVFAKDGGNLSINKTVRIEVLNIQITNKNVSFKEERDPFCFYNVTTNATADGDVIFTLEDQLDGFNISEEGKICTTSRLDREFKDQYYLSIIALEKRSGRKIAQLKLNVVLQDINDNIPYFVSENSLHVQENAKISSLVSPNIEAKDNDSTAETFQSFFTCKMEQEDLVTIEQRCKCTMQHSHGIYLTKMQITYIIIQQHQPGLFLINPKNGSVIVNGTLDRELLGATYIIEVEALDALSQAHNITRNFTINIMDVNDESPKFNQSLQFNISESRSINTIIGKVHAFDKDPKDEIKYQIADGNEYGIFKIYSSGDIYLVSPLDYENTTSFTLTIVAYDIANHTIKGNCTVRIDVMDVNDNKPEFSQPVYTANFSEGGASIGGQVNVSARDKDSGNDGKVSFSIESGNMTGNFKIETIQNSGIITIIAPLDREDGNIQHFSNNGTAVYHLVIIGKDSGSPMLSSTAHVNIYVTDINDCPPKFVQAQYFASLSEETEIGKSIQHVTATDCDFKSNITYSLVNAQDYFGIDDKGEIKLLKPVSIEDNFGDIQIIAFDGIQNASDIVALTSNNNSENFKELKHFISKKFNTPEFFVSNFRVDGVSELAYYGLQDHQNIFDSLLQQNAITDYELRHVCKTADAVDFSQTHANLTINITDSNDHDPNFTQAIYSFSVPENDYEGARAIRNISIGEVKANDADKGENGDISYQILSQAPMNAFAILPKNGTIIRTGVINRENVTSFSLMIGARDNGTKSRQGTCEVRVTVLDINDNSPTFNKQIYVGSVKESVSPQTEVTMNFPIHAEDSDSGENGTAGIRYLVNGTEFFKINDTTGTIYTIKQLDRETQSQYNFTVTATDQDGKGKSSFAQVTIDILDENDCTPYFVMQSYEIQIMENANTSSSIGKVIANDLDVDGNVSVQYHILSGADNKFIIDSHTGDLSVTGKLDREKKSEYILNVSADDGVHMNHTTVIIKILDINDNCPEFYTNVVEYSITENTDPHDVGNFSAFDLDDGENGHVTVFMNDSSLNNSFSVDSDGTLRSLQKFDREEKANYVLEIYAKDHGNPPCTNSIKVVIKIKDENDNPPIFYSEDGTQNITHASSYIVDQSPVGSILLVPNVRDKDEENTNNSHVTYSFEEGYDEHYFKINPTTGAVQISSRIEINTLLHLRNVFTSNMTGNQTLQVLIIAQDGGESSLNSTLLLTVFIEPLNEASPGFEKETYNFSVEENVDASSFIGKVSAVIINDSISHLTYRILDSQESQYIHIDSYTGNITTTAEMFDREKKNHYTFEVQVTDGRTPERTAFTTVELTIEDVNDNCPVFLQKDYKFEIPENVNSTNQIMNISATDADAGRNSRIDYKLEGETDGNFKLNDSTGILEMVRPLDRESRAEYKFTIMAIDEGFPPLNSSTSVVIRVLDGNDNSPIFYGQPYIFNISENDMNVQSYRVHANDSDFGENGSVVYQMTRDGRVPFYIDPLDGTLNLLTPLDYETKHQYRFEILASDLGTVSRKTRTNVTVFVIDVYDFVPHFPENVYEVGYNISQSGTSILDVNAGQGNITYKLTGPDAISFDISKTTGHITLKDKLSPDVMQYIFSVVATDSITKANDSCMVIIHVIGGKVQTDYTVPVPENYNGPFPQIIYDLNSTEEQQGNVLYDLLQIDPSPKVKDKTDGLFKIDNTSGILYCERKLDREEQTQYIITIRISHLNAQSFIVRKRRDNKDQGRIIKLLIIITNVNDNPPTIQRDSLFFHVFKNTKANYIVGKVNAEDDDGDTDLRFNITGKEVDTFHIDPVTGQIITLKDISSTNKMKFMLHVYVTDQDGRGLSSDANITILVIFESDRLILVTDMNKSAFNKSQDILVRNMSEILGVSMFIESIEYHKEVNGGVELLDLEKSDVFIHATNKTTGEILSRDELQRLLNQYGGALDDFFKQMKVKSVQTVPWNILHTTSTMGSAEIALICLAVVIGIGGIAAVCFVKWSEDDDEKQNPEIYELESQHGSTGQFSPAEVINPFFSETNFDERDGVSETTNAKRMVEYETQELHMELPDEIHSNDDDERTDSGVDNESSGSERQKSESHSIVSKEESDEVAVQINLQSVEEPRLDNASNDNANLSERKDHPESMDDSWNADEENLNEGKLNKLTLYGSQILLDATTGDTDDTDPTFETKKETEEKIKEKKTDLSQSISKSIDDTESKLIFADDTKLEYASSNGREQSWMQENINELISEDDTKSSENSLHMTWPEVMREFTPLDVARSHEIIHSTRRDQKS